MALANMKALSRRNDEPTRASRPSTRPATASSSVKALSSWSSNSKRVRKPQRPRLRRTPRRPQLRRHHITAPLEDGSGAAGDAMTEALDDSGLRPTDIDYIAARGTGPP